MQTTAAIACPALTHLGPALDKYDPGDQEHDEGDRNRDDDDYRYVTRRFDNLQAIVVISLLQHIYPISLNRHREVTVGPGRADKP